MQTPSSAFDIAATLVRHEAAALRTGRRGGLQFVCRLLDEMIRKQTDETQLAMLREVRARVEAELWR
jgi:hypothetical protein